MGVRECYGLNVGVPVPPPPPPPPRQIHRWKLNPQGGVIRRWPLWEMIRS